MFEKMKGARFSAGSVFIDIDVLLALMGQVREPLNAIYLCQQKLQERGDQINWGADQSTQDWLDVSGATGLVESMFAFKDLSLPRRLHGEGAEGWGMRFHLSCTMPFRTFMISECEQFKAAYEQLRENNPLLQHSRFL